jgi:hypothetical protein
MHGHAGLNTLRLAGRPAIRMLAVAAQFGDLSGMFAVFAAVLPERSALCYLTLTRRVRAFVVDHLLHLPIKDSTPLEGLTGKIVRKSLSPAPGRQ